MLYELSSRLLLVPMRSRRLRTALTWCAKVWLRQARLVDHLGASPYDGVIDGGASIGEFAALVRLARPDVQLLCVEPHPPSVEVLRRRGFTVIEAALWDRPGVLLLKQLTDVPTSCSLVGEESRRSPTWRVQTVRLDSLPIAGSKLLIKLDLQGAEPEALTGMGDLWQRCSGLLVEVSYGPDGTYELIRALLAERGFYEAATFNELDGASGPTEADKLWLRRGLVPTRLVS